MHRKFMLEALKEAKIAYENNEVPVGAVIVHEGMIIARAHNRREEKNSSISHAEIEAIQIANKYLNRWELNDCTLYVTLEPCIMCAGACIQSRIGTVVYGAKDQKGGSFGSTIDLNEIEGFNHYPTVITGVMKDESNILLKQFFQEVRKKQVDIKQIRNKEDFNKALELRKKVFVIEQHVDSKEEYDEYDTLDREDVIHIIAKVGEVGVGTLRLILSGTTVKVGRVAVDKKQRHMKIGTRLMDAAEKYAYNNGYKELILGAQLQALPFYESCGYEVYGDIFLDANIEHKMMKKRIR